MLEESFFLEMQQDLAINEISGRRIFDDIYNLWILVLKIFKPIRIKPYSNITALGIK